MTSSPAGSPEIRPPSVSEGRLARSRVFLAVQVVFGAACFAVYAAGTAMFLSSHAAPSPGEVRIGRVEDWPEIKNGVPEVMPAKLLVSAEPVAAPAAIPVRETGPAAPPPAQAPAAASEAVVPAAVRSAALRPAAAPDRAPVTMRPRAAEEAAPSSPRPAVRPRPAQHGSEPRRERAAPAQVQQAGVARPPRVAETRGARPAAPQREAAAVAPAQEERVHVLGIPLPAFVPTGRQIKETAASIGDAVLNLPGRL